MSIYVSTHKKTEKIHDDNYKKILVGAYNKEDIGYIKDNDGDSISELNDSFCEVTALHWIWKNTNDNKVGLCHYRRFFVDKEEKNNILYNGKNIAKGSYLLQQLDYYDVILPKPVELRDNANLQLISNKAWYQLSHQKYDLFIVKKVINSKYPEYMKAYNYIMESNFFYPCNIFLMKRKYFDLYMEWLEDILFDIQGKIEISSYDKYQYRVFGFIAERLLNIWICHNYDILKIKEIPYINTEIHEYDHKIKNRNQVKIKNKKERNIKILFFILLIISIVSNFL